MSGKEYVREWGQTTATTLRLTAPFQGKGKVLIIDSWFGSTRTAYALKKLQGTYTVANVKQNSRGFPKLQLLASCPDRGDTTSMSVEVNGVKLYASCHKDKQPMSLIHTCDTMLKGAPRFRTYVKYSKGKVTRKNFTLEQPSVHATYRSTFWAVDRYNKLALGPDSVQYAVRAGWWGLRFFFALLGMSETNANLAINQVLVASGQKPLTRKVWKIQLAKILMANPFGTKFYARMTVQEPTNLWTILQGHLGAVGRKDKAVRVCHECSKAGLSSAGKARTSYQCGCGEFLCRPNQEMVCQLVHMLRHLTVEQFARAKSYVEDESFLLGEEQRLVASKYADRVAGGGGE